MRMRFPLRSKLVSFNLALLAIVTFLASLISSYEIQQYFLQQRLTQIYQQLYEIRFLLTYTNFGTGIPHKVTRHCGLFLAHRMCG